MIDEERCPVTELVKSQCAHCKHSDLRVRTGTRKEESSGEIFTMDAKYPGKCKGCDGYIPVNSMIGKVEGQWVCAECVRDARDAY